MADLVGITTAETVRTWMRQSEVDHGRRIGVASGESAEVERSMREIVDAARGLDPELRVGFVRVIATLVASGRARPPLRCLTL